MKKIIVILAFVSLLPITLNATASPREIPYEIALSRAISRDPSVAPIDRDIRSAEADIRRLQVERLAIIDEDPVAAGIIEAQRTRVIGERNRLQRQRSRHVLNIERNLRTLLAAIANIENNINTLEMTLDLREKMLEQTRLRHEHGMASLLEVNEAQNTLEQTALNLATLHLSLTTERQNLNRLIHELITADIRIIYDVTDFAPLPTENLTAAEAERFIARQVMRDHFFLNWQDEVDARRQEWLSQIPVPEVDNDYMRIQVQVAIAERNIAEHQAEVNIRNTFANWVRLQEAQESINTAITQALSDYEDMQNRFEAGFVTQIQVDFLRLAYEIERARLNLHIYEFWTAELPTTHPYI
ncbi:MAG: TolC family protein [Turicibacter sp.]|nr:TolC family protein [Turicibacter sp.]